ncbi:MAG: c-type cytochrome, partial [Planctomycetota bacterium]
MSSTPVFRLLIRSVRAVVTFMLSVDLTIAQDIVVSDSKQEHGRVVYETRCRSCHGLNGVGTPEVPAPIFGDRSTTDLADLISRTMPEGSPEDCVGEDAAAVAEWMQQAFYSPEAQARLNPPRVELSRLTVSQYRNAVADLAASFRWFTPPKQDRGLKAEYFGSRNFRRDRRVYERQDSNVDFNFGTSSPDWEK